MPEESPISQEGGRTDTILGEPNIRSAIRALGEELAALGAEDEERKEELEAAKRRLEEYERRFLDQPVSSLFNPKRDELMVNAEMKPLENKRERKDVALVMGYVIEDLEAAGIKTLRDLLECQIVYVSFDHDGEQRDLLALVKGSDGEVIIDNSRYVRSLEFWLSLLGFTLDRSPRKNKKVVSAWRNRLADLIRVDEE